MTIPPITVQLYLIAGTRQWMAQCGSPACTAWWAAGSKATVQEAISAHTDYHVAAHV